MANTSSRKVAAIRAAGQAAREGQGCARCLRPSPPQESSAFLDWEALGDGTQVICPECVTPADQQAMDESDAAAERDAENETPGFDKTRVNLLRRMAARQGLRLEKSRTRDPRAIDHGTYRLVKADTGELQSWGGGPYGYGLDIGQIESQLMEGIGSGRFLRAGRGDHVDAEEGSVITIKAGAILDMTDDHGRRFLALEDGSLREIGT